MLLVLLLAVSVMDLAAQRSQTITDAAGRQVTVPTEVSRVICSGPGALRLLSYLGAQDLIVAVDDIEVKRSRFDARPYALANPTTGSSKGCQWIIQGRLFPVGILLS